MNIPKWFWDLIIADELTGGCAALLTFHSQDMEQISGEEDVTGELELKENII